MKKLIMVMGVQRSGTTILFKSFAEGKDKVTFFHENISNDLFINYLLKPVAEIRHILDKKKGPILLKPISETRRRSVQELLDEFHEYDVKIVGIYRDPVNVFYSHVQRGWTTINNGQINAFIEDWNLRNLSLLEGRAKYPDHFAITRYSDLLEDEELYKSLCNFVGIRGKYIFRADSLGGRNNFSPEVINLIDSGTNEIWEELNNARNNRPGIAEVFNYKMDWTLLNSRRDKYSLPHNYEIKPKTPTLSDGLILWLEADKIDPNSVDEPNITWPNSTALDTTITSHGNVKLIQDSINGLPALKIDNDSKEISYLNVESKADWRFMFDGSDFTIFVVYKPTEKKEKPAYKFLVDVDPLISTSRSLTKGPGFSYFWSSKSQSGNAILVPKLDTSFKDISQSIIDSPNIENSHEINTWAIEVCVHTPKMNKLNLNLYKKRQQIRGGMHRNNNQYPLSQGEERNLFLGAVPEEPKMRFNGYIGEILIFRKNLNSDERLSITQYLEEKYGL